jgi:biopolymer transport protein ExbB
MPGWILLTEIASKSVLGILVLLSVWSIAIMIDRYKVLKLVSDSSEELEGLVQNSSPQELKDRLREKTGLQARALKVAMAQSDPAKIDQAVRSYLSLEKTKLEKGFTALATLGSNAPFIGLFGTVLGIIKAFGALATERADTSAMMSGISEALVATAIGLFVAIPAQIAYNTYGRKLKVLLVDSNALKDLYLSKHSAKERGGL